MLMGLLWLLLALLGLILLALALPVRIRLDACSAPVRRVRILTAPFGGAVPMICIVDSARRKSPKVARKQAGPARPRRARRRGFRAVRGIPALVRDLLLRFRIVRISAEGDFGFDDPADTGVVFGMLSPLTYGLPVPAGVSLALRPDFTGPRLSGRFDATVAITPLALVPPLIRFGLRNLMRGRA